MATYRLRQQAKRRNMRAQAQRELDSGCESTALQVLRRFVRNRVAKWRVRCAFENARVLARVFESAAALHHANRPRGFPAIRAPLSAAERHTRVLELRIRTSTPATDPRQALECDSELNENEQYPEDSRSSSECEKRVSVECVVHKLFLQLEASKCSAKVKDARIVELEGLVASLTHEIHQLRQQLQKSYPLTDLSSCNTASEVQHIEVQVSNQLVLE